VWEDVRRKPRAKGITVTGPQCKTKFHSFKKTYIKTSKIIMGEVVMAGEPGHILR
jgi:hypothetical protein